MTERPHFVTKFPFRFCKKPWIFPVTPLPSEGYNSMMIAGNTPPCNWQDTPEAKLIAFNLEVSNFQHVPRFQHLQIQWWKRSTPGSYKGFFSPLKEVDFGWPFVKVITPFIRRAHLENMAGMCPHQEFRTNFCWNGWFQFYISILKIGEITRKTPLKIFHVEPKDHPVEDRKITF